MEEVDSIILHFLRQLSINIDDETKNICDLPVETIIQSAAKCILTINPSIKVPTKLPSGISHRIEVAAQIASICKDLGYKSDVGYQTFLYYNEAELRQVFMFLIEQLPSEGKHISTNFVSGKSLLMQNIGNKIAEDLNSVWIPPCCTAPHQKAVGDYVHQDGRKHTSEKKILNVEELIGKLKDAKSNQNLNVSTSTEKNQEVDNVTEDNKVPEKESISNSNKSLRELKEMSLVLRQKLDTLESERNVMDVEYSQAQKTCEKVESDFNNVLNILKSIGTSGTNNYDNFIEEAHKNIDTLHRKSEEFTSKNLSLRFEIDKIKNSMHSSESERSKCKNILLKLKENAKSIKREYELKEEENNVLKKNYEKLKGGNKRSIYTKRILEIISNVDKQNIEIQKILEDTRQLQKEINMLEGQLDRCFSIADETLFRDAKKDDQAKKAYKLLALLHSECNTIVSLVNETGTLGRELIDLEDNIKTEKAKKTEDTLKKIQFDLLKMQEESATNC